MTSKIKHLQFAKLYLSTHVTNTKSTTPNQLRLRASGFKGFRHIPLGPCSGFKAKLHDFIFLFLLFFFFFFFFSFLEDNIGLRMWVTQTYPRLPTCLRPALQSERRTKSDKTCCMKSRGTTSNLKISPLAAFYFKKEVVLAAHPPSCHPC